MGQLMEQKGRSALTGLIQRIQLDFAFSFQHGLEDWE